jgi:hypothetical protein
MPDRSHPPGQHEVSEEEIRRLEEETKQQLQRQRDLSEEEMQRIEEDAKKRS